MPDDRICTVPVTYKDGHGRCWHEYQHHYGGRCALCALVGITEASHLPNNTEPLGVASREPAALDEPSVEREEMTK